MSAPPTSAPPESKPDARPTNQALVMLRGLGGALAGAILGYILFRWLYRSGLYGIMLPGVLLGTGAGLAARSRSQTLGVICALLAVAATLFTEWHVRFSQHNTFPFFLTHLHTLGGVPLIMMLLGVLGAYWFGQGR